MNALHYAIMAESSEYVSIVLAQGGLEVDTANEVLHQQLRDANTLHRWVAQRCMMHVI